MRKWVSISEYVDLETGEALHRTTIGKEYHIVRTKKKIPKIKDNAKLGFIYYTHECRRHSKQIELFNTDRNGT